MQKQFSTEAYSSHHHGASVMDLTHGPMSMFGGGGGQGQAQYQLYHQQAAAPHMNPFIYNTNNNNQLLSNPMIYFNCPPAPAVCSNIGLQQYPPAPVVAPSSKTYKKSLVMSPDELQRLELKREKNRRAAAKCRFVRRQRQESLEKEVEMLEKKNAGLQILKVKVEKEKILFQHALDQHIPECRIKTDFMKEKNVEKE